MTTDIWAQGQEEDTGPDGRMKCWIPRDEQGGIRWNEDYEVLRR